MTSSVSESRQLHTNGTSKYQDLLPHYLLHESRGHIRLYFKYYSNAGFERGQWSRYRDLDRKTIMSEKEY